MCVELNLWVLSSSGGPISNPDSNLAVGTRTVARSDPVWQSRTLIVTCLSSSASNQR